MPVVKKKKPKFKNLKLEPAVRYKNIRTFSNIKIYNNERVLQLKKSFHTQNVLYYPEDYTKLSVIPPTPTELPSTINKSEEITTVGVTETDSSDTSIKELEQTIGLLRANVPTDAPIDAVESALIDLKVSNVSNISSLKESFPWFYDKEGYQINFNGKVENLPSAILLLSNYLNTKYNYAFLSNDQVKANPKILKLLEPILNNKEGITVKEFYAHIDRLYKDTNTKDEIFKALEYNETEANSELFTENPGPVDTISLRQEKPLGN